MGYPTGRPESKGRRAENEVVDVVHKQFVQELMKGVYEGNLILAHPLGYVHFESAHATAA
jgi:hypothetical protein